MNKHKHFNFVTDRKKYNSTTLPPKIHKHCSIKKSNYSPCSQFEESTEQKKEKMKRSKSKKDRKLLKKRCRQLHH